MSTTRRSQALISDASDLESGIVNPAMEADIEMNEVVPGPSTQVTEETEVESFMLNLTARRRRKQKELSQTTPEPLEKLSEEVRSVKQRSRKALTENSRSSLSSHNISTSHSATSSASVSSKILTDDSGKGGIAKQDGKPVPVPRVRDGTKQKKQRMKIEAGSKGDEMNVPDRSLQKRDTEEVSMATDSETEEVNNIDKRHGRISTSGDEEKEEEEEKKKEEAEEDGDEATDMALSRSTIRDKIKSLREKAKMAAVSEAHQEEQQERKSKIRHFEPQFESNLEKEEKELERRTKEATEKLFRRWSKQKSSTVGQPEITAKQSYDFFTQTWEGSSVLPTESPAGTAKPTTTADDDGDTKMKIRRGSGIVVSGERRRSSTGSRGKVESKITKKEAEEKVKAKQDGSRKGSKEIDKAEEGDDEFDNAYYEDTFPLLGNISDKDSCGYHYMVRAQKICYATQIKSEAEMYYFPSSNSIAPAEKLSESQKEARNLVDEGFYVGSPPVVATSNRNRMEHRLIQEKDKNKKWFGEDGEIITLPDPLKLTPSRPPVPEEEDSNFGVIYAKAEAHEFDTRFMSGCADTDKHYQLDIDINSIVFSQHHLFSMEHVLANKLLALYQQYSKIMNKNNLSFLTKKLRAVKTSTIHLQTYLQNKEDLSEEDKANYKQRLKDYKSEIRRIRKQWDHEEQCCNSLLKAIIQTWKNIKLLREKQKFVATPVKLTICKQEMDREQEDQQWRQEIEEELEEVREEYEESYQQKLIEYQQQLEEWQRKQQLRKEAVKRRNTKAKKKKKVRSEDDENEDDEQAVRDEEILAEEATPKPVCPEAFDERGARESIRAKALECRRHPGTPKLSPEISYTANVTPAADCPKTEQRRRNDVSSCRLFIKVLFNDKQVLQTNQRFLLEDFRVNFGQIYHLKIVQWPESIKLQIYEARTLGSTLLSQLYLAIPETSITTENVAVEQHDFSSDLSIQFTHNAVGSGVAIILDSLSSETTYINTTGSVLCSVAWAIGDDGLPMAPSPQTNLLTKLQSLSHKFDPMAAIGASGIMDLEKLSQWVRTARLDPNDPNNADLMFLLRPHVDDKSQLREQTFFRLEPFQEEFNFATDEDILQSPRFRLLRLRHHEVREFCNYSMVPALDKEIPKTVFKEYELRKKEEEKLQFQEDIEMQRAFVGRYKDKLHEEMLSRFRVAVHRKRQEEVVIEEASPSINMIGKSLLQLLQPRRPLKPVRKERKRVAQGVKGDDIHILINVIQAFNIPVRQTTNTLSETSTTSQFHPNIEETVRPFVEITFQKLTVRTHCADGPNPSFNEELIIPFRTSNHNLTSKNLQSVTDTIQLTIFDEVHVNILQDDTKQDTEIHQRVEKKWLGTLKIPFSTVYFNGKIEGTLQISTPPLLLGYCQPKSNSAEMDSILMPLSDSFITLFVTLQPTLIPPESIKERFDSNEDEKLLQYCDLWQRQLEAKWSKRVYKTTVTDILGKAVFVTRFFKPLMPPKEITAGKTGIAAAQAVSKYVSLIPDVVECRALPGCCDIWTTCDQFLQMLAGDSDEHSILLTNFFLGLGKTAYFGLGNGIPNGVTSCVLTMEENGSCLLWNYKDGRFYYTYTSYLPLHNLGCLMNHKNIWANVQMYDNPCRMNFNVDDGSCWKPFFHSNYPNPGLSSVQVDSLVYTDTDDNYVKELQDKLEKCLKNKISEWRRKHLTRWNRYFTLIIRKILPKLEENCTAVTIKEHITDIEHSWSSYKISGSPINMPFTDIPTVVQSIHEMGIHSYDTSNVEFALAVYIHPYPNNILSVWVYVAALLKMR